MKLSLRADLFFSDDRMRIVNYPRDRLVTSGSCERSFVGEEPRGLLSVHRVRDQLLKTKVEEVSYLHKVP